MRTLDVDAMEGPVKDAAEAGRKAIFDMVRDLDLPDAEKIGITIVAVHSLFMAMLDGAARPENAMQRKLLLALVAKDTAPAIAALYQGGNDA